MLHRIVLALVVCSTATNAQENSLSRQRPAQENSELPHQPPRPASPMPEQTQVSPVAPCLQPPPVVRWQDYEGPFKKTVGIFARRLERKSVSSSSVSHYKPGTVLCSLTLSGKLLLFAQNTFDPATFLTAGINAGLGQARNSNPSYGQGAEGYFTRFGASFADQASSEFFTDVFYAEIFREDPRYYRLGSGSVKRRFFHALEHAFVARREDGANQFNFSEWLGTTSAVALGNVYHPDRSRGVGPAAERIALSIARGAGSDVLREFWPEIAHNFKLPFRDESPPQVAPLEPTPPSESN